MMMDITRAVLFITMDFVKDSYFINNTKIRMNFPKKGRMNP